MESVAESIHYETEDSRQEGQRGVGLFKVTWGIGGAGVLRQTGGTWAQGYRDSHHPEGHEELQED